MPSSKNIILKYFNIMMEICPETIVMMGNAIKKEYVNMKDNATIKDDFRLWQDNVIPDG